jgi:ABC-type multidrug transport system fused ATPase/permease subunit
LRLFDEYVHGLVDRRGFLEGAAKLQTARAADRIVVIEKGRIVETGSHDQLVQAGGRYQRLWGAFQRGDARVPSLRAIA